MQGHWVSEKTSASLAAELHVDGLSQVRVISIVDNLLLHTCKLADIKVLSRVGNVTRNLLFNGGEKFETQDHVQVDLLLKKYSPPLLDSLAHQLQSHILFVCVNLLLAICLSWAGIKYGLPAASKIIADRLPQSMLDSTSTETLRLLDKIYLQPTELDESVQARVVEHFAPTLKENAHLYIQVIFRGGGDLGAHAFALPNGTIIFTDEMINLAKNDDELVAVLVHEIGHVKYRHGLRSVIESSSLGLKMSMLMGDSAAASNLLTALPVILITMPYSADFEREADQNALEYLDAKNIQRHILVDLMERVTHEARCDFVLRMKPDFLGENKEAISDSEEIYSSTAAVTATAMATTAMAATESAAAAPAAAAWPTAGWSDAATAAAAHKSSLKSKGKIAAKTEDTITAKIDDPVVAMIQDLIAARKMQCDKLIASHDFEKETIKDYFSTHPGTKERLQKFK